MPFHKVKSRVKRFLSDRLRIPQSVVGLYADESAKDVRHLFHLLTAVHQSQLPSISLGEIASRLRSQGTTYSDKVAMHPVLLGIGSGSAAEMATLASLTFLKNPKTILEFGTCDGCSTWHLWANSNECCKIVTIDLPVNTTAEGSTDPLLQGIASRPFLPKDNRIEVIETDSREWKAELDTPVDLCFIDAGHSLACVKNDTEKALGLMAPSGIIVWHDAAWTQDGYAVNAYLRELREQGHDIQIIHAGPYDYCALAILLLGRE